MSGATGMDKPVMPKLVIKNYLDNTNAPAGGEYECIGLNIRWQKGPLKYPGETEFLPPNGAFVETVIEAAKVRLEFYQTTRFTCEENAEAISHLEAALKILRERIARRTAAGTIGTHKPD
jgi:hypothetical protein